jgi:hypothetical protein
MRKQMARFRGRATVRVTCAEEGISICYEQQPIQNLHDFTHISGTWAGTNKTLGGY